MNEPESVPSAGSLVGRYQLLREIAKGPFGPLYELRSADGASKLSGLGRLIVLPSELAPEVEQAISEAAWESMELRYDFALSVADVVFGKGWITLVHDHSEGSLLRSLQRRASERQSAFPVAVALRVATDLLDGLEQNHSACDAAGITWCPGGASPTSLYLCGDGRTRALDGQVAAALTQVAQIRKRVGSIGFPAPELLDSERNPDERTDIFAVGAVLWELLTGHELALGEAVALGQRPRPKVPNLNLAVPKGTTLPAELVKIVHAALELDSAKRPATTYELRRALAQAGEAASYERVIDFTDALLNRESTLFRLTLDAGPKLSDAQPSERPKPTHLEWAADLAKHARAAEAQRTAKVAPALVVRSPQAASRTGESLGPREAEPAPVARKPLGQKTLIGVAAPREAAPAAKVGAGAAPRDPALASTLAASPAAKVGAGAAPREGALTSAPAPAAKVGAAAIARDPALASTSAASPAARRSIGGKTLIGIAVPPSSPGPQRSIPSPAATAPVDVAPDDLVLDDVAPDDLVPADVVSPPVVETASKSEPIAALIAQALPVPAAERPPAPASGAPSYASPLSLDSAFAPVAANAPPTASRASVPGPLGKRVFELTLPKIVLGLTINTLLAVTVTLLIQKAFSPAASISSVALDSSARPGSSTVQVAAPAPEPPAAAPSAPTAPAPEPSAAASPPTPTPAAAETTTAGPKPANAPAKDSTVTPAPAAPRQVVRKRRRQYVPNEL